MRSFRMFLVLVSASLMPLSSFAGDVFCDTGSCLVNAIENANAGDVIRIGGSISLTNKGRVVIDKPITIDGGGTEFSSGQGTFTNSNGARIYKSDGGIMFLVQSEGVVFQNLDLHGGCNGSVCNRSASAIYVNANNFKITKSEIQGWSNGVIVAKNKNIEISYNYIHHNRNDMNRNGYGVTFDAGGHALVAYNDFNWNRHAIAGGSIDVNNQPGYEASYNWVGPNSESHDFDMHGCQDYEACDGVAAGKNIRIHHNTFTGTKYTHVVIRGVPTEYAYVYYNQFVNRRIIDGAVKQCYLEFPEPQNMQEWTNWCENGVGCRTYSEWRNEGQCAPPPHP